MIAAAPPRFSVLAKFSAQSKAARIRPTAKTRTIGTVPVKHASTSALPPRSAEAEHREILRLALTGAPATRRQEAADRLAAFRQRTADRGGPSAGDLLAEARAERARSLAGSDT